jgi:hypothetical protein
MSVLSLFAMSTFENWSAVYYINYSGCDTYSSEYLQAPANFTERVETMFGVFHTPVCYQPHGQPIAASFIFLSFMFIKPGPKDIKSPPPSAMKSPDNKRRSSVAASKASKLTGADKEHAATKKLLKVVWGEASDASYRKVKTADYNIFHIRSFAALAL